MPKVGMEPIRRSQIIEAVLKIIASDGIKEITLDKAARNAGVSKGVVAYYFSNKESLILESCEAFFESYSKGIVLLTELPVTLIEMLQVIAYTAVGKWESVDGLKALEDGLDAPLHEHPQDPEEGIVFSLNHEEQQKIILQLFGESVSNGSLKSLLQKTYQNYFEQIRTIIGGLMRPHIEESLIDVYTVQYMALVDGILLYDALGIQSEQLLQALDVFLETTFVNSKS